MCGTLPVASTVSQLLKNLNLIETLASVLSLAPEIWLGALKIQTAHLVAQLSELTFHSKSLDQLQTITTMETSQRL